MIKISENTWNNLDFEIRPIVKLLNNHNFRTICSCSGEMGHSFKYPIVILEDLSNKEYNRLIKLLIDTEIFGFEISTKENYKDSSLDPERRIEITFYDLNRFRFSLLNVEEINEIKEKYRTKKYTQKQLAEEYELDIWDIKNILNNRKYWI